MKKNTVKDFAIALHEFTKGLSGNELSKVIEQFAKTIIKNNLLKQTEKIFKEYTTYAKKQEGIIDIEITSARQLDESVIKNISQTFGKKVETVTKIDPTILGGIKVKTDSKIFDASLKTQLQRLKQKIQQ